MHFTLLRIFALLSLVAGINTQLMGAAHHRDQNNKHQEHQAPASSLNPDAKPWYPDPAQKHTPDEQDQDKPAQNEHHLDTCDYDELSKEIANTINRFIHHYDPSAQENIERENIEIHHTCLNQGIITPPWILFYEGIPFAMDSELALTIEQALSRALVSCEQTQQLVDIAKSSYGP